MDPVSGTTDARLLVGSAALSRLRARAHFSAAKQIRTILKVAGGFELGG
jgi:hypothetical protein